MIELSNLNWQNWPSDHKLALLNRLKARNLSGGLPELAEKSLHEFCRQAWHVVEPGVQFVDGRHIGLICEHLEAVSLGQIKKLLINVPPGTMKPVDEREPVLVKGWGRIPLADVQVGDQILTHSGRYRRVLAVHEQGQLGVWKICTHAGRVVRAAPDHPFLTTRGWIQVKELNAGDVLAAVIPQEPAGTDVMSDQEARLLGYLVGDGCTLHQCEVTNGDEAILLDVEHCAASLGFFTRRKSKPGCKASTIVIKASADKWRGPWGCSPVTAWLKRHELKGKSSYTKRIPNEVLAAGDRAIAQFVGAYWSCDGMCSPRIPNSIRVQAETVSAGLAVDVQHALLRLGIEARVIRKEMAFESKRQGNRYVSWRIALSTQNQVALFAERVPMAHPAKTAAMLGMTPTEFPRVLSEDKIVSVEPDGFAACRCLSVEEDSSFTASDLAVHNSLITSVFWPSWEWIRNPASRWFFASYGSELSTRDSLRCRNVIQSDWYQLCWGDRFSLVADQNQKTKFENDHRGWRMSTSVGGAGTGAHPDFLVADDPHSAQQAESDVERQEAINWWTGTISTRGKSRGVRQVVIMQRLDENDLSGYLLEQGGWEHVCLPMRYEPGRMKHTSIGGCDWRQADGELLWPELFPEKPVLELERDLTSRRAPGQLQQRPTAKGGDLFKREWFLYFTCKSLPAGKKAPPGSGSGRLACYFELLDRNGKKKRVFPWDCWWFQACDTATDEKESSAYTVVGTFAVTPEGDLLAFDVDRQRLEIPKQYGFLIRKRHEFDWVDFQAVEKASSGIGLIQLGKAKGTPFRVLTADKSKEQRAETASIMSEGGSIYFLRGALWLPDFEAELVTFLRGKHKDQADVLSYAALLMVERGMSQGNIRTVEDLEKLDDAELASILGEFGDGQYPDENLVKLEDLSD